MGYRGTWRTCECVPHIAQRTALFRPLDNIQYLRHSAVSPVYSQEVSVLLNFASVQNINWYRRVLLSPNPLDLILVFKPKKIWISRFDAYVIYSLKEKETYFFYIYTYLISGICTVAQALKSAESTGLNNNFGAPVPFACWLTRVIIMVTQIYNARMAAEASLNCVYW